MGLEMQEVLDCHLTCTAAMFEGEMPNQRVRFRLRRLDPKYRLRQNKCDSWLAGGRERQFLMSLLRRYKNPNVTVN